MEEQKQNEQGAKVLTFDEAMQALQEGKVLHMIDDGKGMMLPGLCMSPPPTAIASLASAMILEDEDIVTQCETLIMNVVNVAGKETGDSNEQFILRFYTPKDFSPASLWVYDGESTRLKDMEDEAELVQKATVMNMSGMMPVGEA